MTVLVVGGGGREHALVKKIAASPRVRRVLCAPGNAGIVADAECVPVAAEDVAGLRKLAREQSVDLVVVGPEAPLAAGLVDALQEDGRRVFGPRRAGAELESSKTFAKTLMKKHGIPTAVWRSFDDPDDARAYLRSILDWPVVIKADGLAAGKGVVIAKNLLEADRTVRQMMEERRFGDAGRRIVVEECLKGEEASIIALTDGKTIALLESSQDHKAAFDGDEGPNTGGMGAYSPAPIVTSRILDQVVRDVLVPVVHALHKEGRPYQGVLYAGLMITKGGPKVLEFNVRFGDPEAQVILARLKTDFVDLASAVVDGTLDRMRIEWDPRPAICVVLASRGYPEKPETGMPIHGLSRAARTPETTILHAATALVGGEIVSSGGRVLNVVAMGDDLGQARERAYEAVEHIVFEGAFHRTDIGRRGLPDGADDPR